MRKTGAWRKGSARHHQSSRDLPREDGNLEVLSSEQPEIVEVNDGGGVDNNNNNNNTKKVKEVARLNDESPTIHGNGIDTTITTTSAPLANETKKDEAEDAVDAEIREARAILEESKSIRNSIRGLLAEKVTGDSFMEAAAAAEATEKAEAEARKKAANERASASDAASASKENAPPPPSVSPSSGQAPNVDVSSTGLDHLLDKREAKVAELREHMDHLRSAASSALANADNPSEEDEKLVLFPSDFTRLVDELFQRRKADGSPAQHVDGAASSTKIHQAVAIALAIDEHEHGPSSSDISKTSDIHYNDDDDNDDDETPGATKLRQELAKVDRLDKDLAACLQQADEVARKVYPEKYAALDAKRKEKLERRVNSILEKDRKEKLRQKRLEKILEETGVTAGGRLTADDEKLVEDIMSRGDGDDAMLNPYDEVVDDDEFSETMSAIMQAIERRSSMAGPTATTATGQDGSVILGDDASACPPSPSATSARLTGSATASSPFASPSKRVMTSTSLLSDASATSRRSAKHAPMHKENIDYLAQFREEKAQHQQLRDIDAQLIKLKTSAYPETLDANVLQSLLNDCRQYEDADRDSKRWQALEEEHHNAAASRAGNEEDEDDISDEVPEVQEVERDHDVASGEGNNVRDAISPTALEKSVRLRSPHVSTRTVL